jgi:hypothetical protein
MYESHPVRAVRIFPGEAALLSTYLPRRISPESILESTSENFLTVSSLAGGFPIIRRGNR